jgi:hypothetical protein
MQFHEIYRISSASDRRRSEKLGCSGALSRSGLTSPCRVGLQAEVEGNKENKHRFVAIAVHRVGVPETSLNRGASPLGLPYTLSRAPLRRRAPVAWLTRSRSLALRYLFAEPVWVCEIASSVQDSRWAARPGLRVRSPTASRNPGNATTQPQGLPEKRTKSARSGTAGNATAAALRVTTEWTSGSEARNCRSYAVMHRTKDLIDAHRFPKDAVHVQVS